MAFIPVPNTARVAIKFLLNGQVCINTTYAQFNVQPSTADLIDLGGITEAWARLDYLADLGDDVSFQGVEVRDLTDIDGDGIETPPVSPASGGEASQSLPNNVTFSIKRLTGFSGRSRRGRVYVVGIPAVYHSDSRIDSDWADQVTQSWNAYGPAIVSAGWQEVVVSLQANKQPRTTGLTTPVTLYTYDDLVLDSQRRRLPGRGT